MALSVVTTTPATAQSVPTVPETVAVPVAATSEPAAQIIDKEAAIAVPVKQENGEVISTASLGVNMVGGHNGSMQGRPAQGNNQVKI